MKLHRWRFEKHYGPVGDKCIRSSWFWSSTSVAHLLCVLLTYLSAHPSFKEFLYELSKPFCKFGPVWPFFSDLFYQQGVFTHRAATHFFPPQHFAETLKTEMHKKVLAVSKIPKPTIWSQPAFHLNTTFGFWPLSAWFYALAVNLTCHMRKPHFRENFRIV